ncbi:hypothetical protein J4423_05460 [Candidatus Pacearchaeota archaeon]|nr:hypothetical protein [Candidatus Pacearchaeota archaeon]
MNKKYLLIIDSVLILGSLLSMFFVVGYTQPLVVAPLNDNGESLMFTLPNVDYLLVDEDLKFGSPKTVFIDEDFNLPLGRYYIKIDSSGKSEIREIKSQVEIILKLKKLEDGSVGVFNVGDSALKVEAYKIGTSINSSLISVDSSSGNGDEK